MHFLSLRVFCPKHSLGKVSSITANVDQIAEVLGFESVDTYQRKALNNKSKGIARQFDQNTWKKTS